jgi:hypothetical protein
MNYKPIIIYDAIDKPYLQVPLTGIDEDKHNALIGVLERTINRFVSEDRIAKTMTREQLERQELSERVMCLLSRYG